MSERDRRREHERERNRGVAVRLWKREGVIPPGFAGTVARWRREHRTTEEDNR